MFLDSVNKSIELVLGSASAINPMPIVVDYVDLTPTTTLAGSVDSQSSGITPVTILPAPNTATQRKVNGLTVYNADTVAGNVTIRLNNSATVARSLITTTLQAGDTLGYTDTRGWYVQDSQGQLKTSAVTFGSTVPLMDGAASVGISQTAARADHIHPVDSSLIPLAQMGIAGGVATLDAGAKIPVAQMPSTVVGAMNYQGAWDASTNTPALVSSIGTKGFYYVVSTAGTTNLDGKAVWSVNDTVVFNGTTWDNIQGSVTASEIATALGYVAESSSNKSDDSTLVASSAILYPTQRAVKVYADAAIVSAVTTASTDATAKANAARTAALANTQLGVFNSTVTPLLATPVLKAFLYDTSKDSDGGAWRKRCSALSWENEALCPGKYLGKYADAVSAAAAGGLVGDYFYNTTTATFAKLASATTAGVVYRGNRRDFPEQVLITVEAKRVILWDTTQVGCPMWMVINCGYQFLLFANGTTQTLSCVAALNGKVAIGVNGAGFGISTVDFLLDNAKTEHSQVTPNTGTSFSNIANRHVAQPRAGDNSPVLNVVVNSIAMVALPKAPVHQSTGLPIPTTFLGTAGGISTIKDTGIVANCLQSTWTFNTIFNLALSMDGMTLMAQGVNATGTTNANYTHFDIPLAVALAGTTTLGTYATGNGYRWDTGTSTCLSETKNRAAAIGRSSGLALAQGARNAASVASGMGVIKSDTMQCFISNAFNSGWMNGDIRGAWLSDAVAGTVTTSVLDRSPSNNPLTVVGAPTAAAVASGAQLVSYNLLNPTNYLEQAYSANLDFGVGDFSFVWWENVANLTTQRFLRDTVGAAATNAIGIRGAGANLYYVQLGTAYINTGVTISGVGYRQVILQRKAGVAQLYVDGVLKWSAANTANLSNTTAVLRVGTDTQATPTWNGTAMTLLRASATAFTQDQITLSYETERKLFAAGSKCCIQGGSTSVNTVAYDDATNLLHVGTNWGRTSFNGLVVQASQVTDVGVPNSYYAEEGVIIEAGSLGVKIYSPAKYLRDEIARAAEQARLYGKELITQSFIATAAQTAFVLPVGFIPKNCYQNGLLKKQAVGAGFWTFAYDGFRYSVILGTGAAVSDDISILCTRN